MSFDAASVSGLRKWVAQARQDSEDLMTAGRCADFSEYRYSVGYIRALDDVIKVLEQIQVDLQKG